MTDTKHTPMTADEALAAASAVYDALEEYARAVVRLEGRAEAAERKNTALIAERDASDKFAWADGYPPYPHAEEWFLADTEFGPMVLRSLSEEYAHDYTTADHTYIMKEKVRRWMQLPGSQFVAYASAGQIFELRAERDALRKCLKEYRRLHDFISDAIEGGRLTEADVPDDYHAFIHQLEECARLEYFANQAIDAARAESGSHG